ncbi:MAG TPA: glycosyltransferase, partial [Gemmatirosa sp.]
MTVPVAAARSAPPARSTWLVSLYYEHGWEHGAHLRTFAIAREWVRQGAEVHFVALEFDHTDQALPGPYLERLRDEGIITAFDRIRLRHTWLRGKLARGMLHPGARDVALRPERSAMRTELETIARRRAPNAVVFADTHLLFAAPQLRRYAPVTVDWKDSHALQYARAQREAVRRGDWRDATLGILERSEATLEERYYGLHVDHNVFVSPIDASAMTRLLGSAATVHTVPNGIRARPAPSTTPREPGRLIFSGAMDFAPNHHAAVWFIRQVLPRVVAQRSDARFVVAGSNPLPELRALAGPNVEITGWVDDMRAELARSALYVAPMRSGSGFKNKVVEALAAGTYVVGTALAFEFLPDPLRAPFTAADSPSELAHVVLRALDCSAHNTAAVAQFWQLAQDEFDWAHVATRFAGVIGTPSRIAPALLRNGRALDAGTFGASASLDGL